MSTFRPKYITFDCYGTLTNFDMAGAARRVYGEQLLPEAMASFVEASTGYRLDEVLGPWKPFLEVVHNSIERSCKRNRYPFKPEDAQRIYEEVPTWGPHPDVPAGLARGGQGNPAGDPVQLHEQPDHVERGKARRALSHGHHRRRGWRLQAADEGLRIHARQARLRPEDITHVSSSFRYDLMTAYDLGIKSKVWVNRGHEPANPFYEYTEIKDIGGLAAAVGLEPVREVA